ncbi:gp53-like domain-containing protein [Pedomonas mirosovicensis]|uniref:gp53-like domain-containing protein n=1 Tax=Pedomonas mirosovicensis TaxID=2908641 RepID=UPI002168A764|nr:hypothetical protein [Pedomonas mirosovicensis]MCH8686461.1 hypothetical protein [Pedomonas mirosovicensis]
MSGLSLTITDAGRAALVNAANNGTAPVLMASVGVSATAITPTPNAATLPGEIKRISTLSGEAVADDTIHVTVRDESGDTYTVRSFALYLADGTLFALYGQAEPIMEKSAQAMLLLSIDVTFAEVDAAQITFGDTSFLNPPATTERQGVVELATSEETTNGVDAVRAVTPKGLKAAITNWLDNRFGAGAPSSFVKSLLTSASASAFRSLLDIKSAALKDEGAGNGLDADLLDGLQGSAYAKLSGANFTGSIGTAGKVNLTYGNTLGLLGLSVSGTAINFFNNVTGTTSNVIYNWLGSNGVSKMSLTEGGELSVKGSTVWHSGNDGAGSGLDADMIDGLHRPLHWGYNTTGVPADGVTDPFSLAIGGTLFSLHTNNGYSGTQLAYLACLGGGDVGARGFYLSSLYGSGDLMLLSRPAGWTRVWTAGNDGSGSGLDADLLDGLHASDFAKLADFVASKSAYGYCKLPNGMIIQAGRFTAANDSTVTLTFPVAFPSLCMGVVVSGTAHLSADAQDNNPAVRSGSVYTTSFQVFNAAETTQAFFIAFGY